jgi:hypothetical protein
MSISPRTTNDEMHDTYMDFTSHFLERIPAHQASKRSRFVPPVAWIHTRSAVRGWIGLMSDSPAWIAYDPNLDAAYIYDRALQAYEATLELKGFLGSGFVIKD